VQPPTREELDALEHGARRRRAGGIALLSSGAVLAAAGVGLLIASYWADDVSCVRYYGYYGNSWTCRNATLAFAGGTTLVLGVAGLIPGIALYYTGTHELAQARALRRGPAWSVRPSIRSHGALAELSLRF
jgi:hypothetical protein